MFSDTLVGRRNAGQADDKMATAAKYSKYIYRYVDGEK